MVRFMQETIEDFDIDSLTDEDFVIAKTQAARNSARSLSAGSGIHNDFLTGEGKANMVWGSNEFIIPSPQNDEPAKSADKEYARELLLTILRRKRLNSQ